MRCCGGIPQDSKGEKCVRFFLGARSFKRTDLCADFFELFNQLPRAVFGSRQRRQTLCSYSSALSDRRVVSLSVNPSSEFKDAVFIAFSGNTPFV